jgi:hypothetical protein
MFHQPIFVNIFVVFATTTTTTTNTIFTHHRMLALAHLLRPHSINGGIQCEAIASLRATAAAGQQ